MKVEVIRKPLKYARVLHPVGKIIEMSGKDARLFEAIGRVQEPVAPVADLPAAPSVPVSLVTREYDHPGLDADDEDLLGGTTPADAAPTAAVAAEPASAQSRKYRRRDMTAGK